MGITFTQIELMKQYGLFGNGKISVLDVGSSNLYSATARGVSDFLVSFGVPISSEVDEFSQRLASGSFYDPIKGGINGAFVGELLEKAGMKYHAIDIADGYATTIIDLNHEPTPTKFVGAFDLVLNFGTTEHLLNQYNAFGVVHDSTKVGGHIVHQLPCVGFSNHGFFTYTPRCMFDLAGYNQYELVEFWFGGPEGNNDLFRPVSNNLSRFPKLSNTLATRQNGQAGAKVAELYLPDISLTVIYKKIKDRPFVGALDTSTSVGAVPSSVTSRYETRFKWIPGPLRKPARRLRDLFVKVSSR